MSKKVWVPVTISCWRSYPCYDSICDQVGVAARCEAKRPWYYKIPPGWNEVCGYFRCSNPKCRMHPMELDGNGQYKTGGVNSDGSG